MTSKKSVSNSTLHKSLPRKRVLKRGDVKFEPTTLEHFPYAWAAYKQGAFEDSEFFPEGLTAKGFEKVLGGVIETLLSGGLSEILTVFAKGPEGVMPVGLITVQYSERLAFPHVYWFPWCTPRNKVEVGVKFFIQLKKNHLVLVTTEDGPDVKYFSHLCDYGLLRAVGKIRDYYSEGHGAMLFQSVGT